MALAKNVHGKKLEQPIIFVGMGRSGTTLMFESFATHRELGWPSNYCEMFPGVPSLNLLCPLFERALFGTRGLKQQYAKTRLGNRFLPQPSEAYPYWDRYANPEFSHSYMAGGSASFEDINRARRAVALLLAYQRKSRLAAKITGPGRIAFLHSIFPDARFVHVVRDGRAVVDSLLRVKFWREGGGLERPFWDDPLPESLVGVWAASNHDPAVLAAVQWLNVIVNIREEAAALPGEQFTEVRYEDFVSDPRVELAGLYDFSELERYPGLLERALQFKPMSTMNEKYRDRIEPRVLEAITDCMRPVLEQYDYVN